MKPSHLDPSMWLYEPTLITRDKFSLLLTLAPSNCNISQYISLLQKYKVNTVIQLCEPGIYDPSPIHGAGINVINWKFPDGTAPPKTILIKWLLFLQKQHEHVKMETSYKSESSRRFVVALHCVAGLGRAPLLAAIALIESGTPAMDAIREIRQKRQGAFNTKQIHYLLEYKPKAKHLGAASPSCHVL